MNLVAPSFLYALVLFVPIVVAFLVRKQKNVLRVPSTMVWRMSAKVTARSKRVKDLRRMLALLACLLGVGALVFAAARPSGKRAGTTIYVVDVSASMNGASFAAARAWLRSEIAGMATGARVGIVVAGSEARSVLPLTPPGPLTDQAIDSLAPERDTAALEDAIALADGLARVDPATRVVVLTDQPLDAEISHREPKPTVRVFPHASVDNVGIVSLFTRSAPEATDEEEREANVVLASSSKGTRRARLVLTHGGRTVADRRVDIAEDADTTERVVIRGAGRLVARVTSDDGKPDALAIDDEAHLDEVARRPPRVALVRSKEADATRAFFVEKALRAAGVTEIRELDPEGLSAADSGDVVVALRDGAARPHDLPTFFVGAPAPELGISGESISRKPGATGPQLTRVRSIAAEDPLMRGVALDDTTTLRAEVLKTMPRGARSLVDLDAGPALVAGGAGKHAWVWLGIAPDASDIVLRVAFPVLVGNILADLGGGSQIVSGKAIARSEITFAAPQVVTPLGAPYEPRWRVPTSPSMLLAGIGALLLALEAWLTFRRRWAL